MLMEADVQGRIGAARHERNDDRTTQRNGYRDRTLDTRLGSLQLRIPKLRQGSYFPPFLEARKTSEKALIAVIQEAWIDGVSTRRVEDLVQAMGLEGISKSTVSKLCADIDERVHAFLDRPLTGEWPYLWLDATYLKQRQGGSIVNVAAIIAVAANTDGKREIVGMHIPEGAGSSCTGVVYGCGATAIPEGCGACGRGNQCAAWCGHCRVRSGRDLCRRASRFPSAFRNTASVGRRSGNDLMVCPCPFRTATPPSGGRVNPAVLLIYHVLGKLRMCGGADSTRHRL